MPVETAKNDIVVILGRLNDPSLDTCPLCQFEIYNNIKDLPDSIILDGVTAYACVEDKCVEYKDAQGNLILSFEFNPQSGDIVAIVPGKVPEAQNSETPQKPARADGYSANNKPKAPPVDKVAATAESAKRFADSPNAFIPGQKKKLDSLPSEIVIKGEPAYAAQMPDGSVEYSDSKGRVVAIGRMDESGGGFLVDVMQDAQDGAPVNAAQRFYIGADGKVLGIEDPETGVCIPVEEGEDTKKSAGGTTTIVISKEEMKWARGETSSKEMEKAAVVAKSSSETKTSPSAEGDKVETKTVVVATGAGSGNSSIPKAAAASETGAVSSAASASTAIGGSQVANPAQNESSSIAYQSQGLQTNNSAAGANLFVQHQSVSIQGGGQSTGVGGQHDIRHGAKAGQVIIEGAALYANAVDTVMTKIQVSASATGNSKPSASNQTAGSQLGVESKRPRFNGRASADRDSGQGIESGDAHKNSNVPPKPDSSARKNLVTSAKESFAKIEEDPGRIALANAETGNGVALSAVMPIVGNSTTVGFASKEARDPARPVKSSDGHQDRQGDDGQDKGREQPQKFIYNDDEDEEGQNLSA